MPAPFGAGGGVLTSMLRALELAPAPSSSIARAFTLYVPAGTLLQL